MKLTRSSADTAPGPADWFTGDVYIDHPQPDDQSAVGCAHGRRTAGRFMAHVAIQEADDQGEVVTWLEHVTDDDYAAQG